MRDAFESRPGDFALTASLKQDGSAETASPEGQDSASAQGGRQLESKRKQRRRDRKGTKTERRARREARNKRQKQKRDKASRHEREPADGEGERKPNRKRRRTEADTEKSAASKERPGGERANPSKREKRTKAVGRKKGKRQRDSDEGEDLADGAFAAEEELLSEAERGRARKGQRLSNPVTAALQTDDESGAIRLFSSLQAAFRTAGFEVVPSPSEPHLLIHVGDAQTPLQRGAKATIVVDRGDHSGRENRRLAFAAKASDAIYAPVQPILRRTGTESTEDVETILARNIRDCVLTQLEGTWRPAADFQPTKDFTAALEWAEDPLRLLKSLDWSAKMLPKSLGISCEVEDVEHFVGGSILLTVKKQKQPTPVYLPFNWSTRVRGAEDEFRLYGLDFVTSMLSYWFMKANRAALRPVKKIDSTISEKGITASALLGGAAAVILDCIRATDSLPQRAWSLPVMQRRARAFALFLLCCRLAALRQIKFDTGACAPTFKALLYLLERMRPAVVPEIGTAAAVAEHAILIALALPLRKISFGEILLEQTIESLCLHLELGMSPDGVWHEGFAQQTSILEILDTLVADLRHAQVAAREISVALVKLARFASAFLLDGISPTIGELPAGRYPKIGKTIQSVLKAVPRPMRVHTFGGQELRDVAFFPQAGFFISRAPKLEKQPASHFVLQARPADLGGPSLSFSLGTTPLLVGGGTIGSKASADIRRASREDAATHNTIRIDSRTYAELGGRDSDVVRIDTVWDEKSWSAARMINDIFPQAKMTRTAIHLKSAHALLVIDEVITTSVPIEIEQFWHLAPGLQQQHGPSISSFALPERGYLNIAFDDETDVAFSTGGDGLVGWTAGSRQNAVANPYIVRKKRANTCRMAGLFRWSSRPVNSQLHIEPMESGWQVVTTGDAPLIRFAFEYGRLELVPDPA